LLCAAAFFAPFLIGHPADAVGVIVNALIITAALKLDRMRVLPVIIIAVLGVIMRAIVFGPLVPFLPVVALLALAGNAILVYFIRMEADSVLGTATGIMAKTAFMATAATVLAAFGILPPPVLSLMGFFQMYTAAIGGAFVLLAREGAKRYLEKV
jgi:hypothetical protein